MTRAGTVLAYDTDAPACSPGSWPRFHHDNANSGDYSRDAALPGQAVRHRGQRQHDHLQGAGRRPAVRHGDHYEVVQSNGTDHSGELLRARSRSRARPRPRRPGTTQTDADPAGAAPLRRDARGGRAGQRGTARGHGGRELRAAARAPRRCACRSFPPSGRAQSPNRSHGAGAQLPVLQSAAAGLDRADRRVARRQRQARELGRRRAAGRHARQPGDARRRGGRAARAVSITDVRSAAATCPTTRASCS